jgi:hypothetical protein
VREVRIARTLVALGCIAMLVVCTATSPSGAHLDAAIPVFALCFLATLTPFLLQFAAGKPAAQPISFLALRISRPPPAA